MKTTRSKRPRHKKRGSLESAMSTLRRVMGSSRFLLPVTLPDGQKIVLLPDLHLAPAAR